MSSIKPNINVLIDEITEEIAAKTNGQQEKESLKRAKKMLKEVGKKIDVPIEIFPPEIQDFILTNYNFYKYPIDYYFGSILTVAGVAIGNTYTAEYQPNWEGVGMLWMVLVGGSSIGKSQAMKPCLQPLRVLQKKFIEENQEAVKKWLVKNETVKNQKLKDDINDRPKPKRIVTNKVTIEKAIELLFSNVRGILISRSEIRGWLKSMNQYQKGDDQENYMEWWDNDDWSDDKKSTGFVYIERPFVGILGGIQTDIVQKMASGDNAVSGFFQRLLFAMPNDETIPSPKEGHPDTKAYQRYEKAITDLYELDNLFMKESPDGKHRVITCKIPLDAAAKKIFFEYRKKSVEKRNETNDDVIKSTLGKLETYVLRFAIIIELLHFVCANHKSPLTTLVGEGYTIGKDTISKAIKVADYFEHTARKITDRLESPINCLKPPQKVWYESLPEFNTFKASTAIELAKKIRTESKVKGLAERTVKDLLRRKDLFKKVQSGGYYERLF